MKAADQIAAASKEIGEVIAQIAEDVADLARRVRALEGSEPSPPMSVKEFATRHPTYTVGHLRGLLALRGINGLEESGAIVRRGRRRLLIEPQRFFAWVKGQGGASRRGVRAGSRKRADET